MLKRDHILTLRPTNLHVCCSGIQQVVTLLRRRKSSIHATPVFLALLQRKTEQTYSHLWRAICDEMPGLTKLKKLFIHMDFETAMRNAVLKHIPNAVLLVAVFI